MARTLRVPLAAMACLAALCAAVPGGAASGDPLFGSQWSLAKVGIEGAWATATGKGVTIAVLDTGVDLLHQDLKGHIAAGGRDFVDGKGAQDVHGHGSFVAGIAAAVTGNGLGIAGAARNAKILPLRISGSNGQASSVAISDAIEWALQKGAKVINLSFTAAQVCPPVVPCVPAGPEALVPGLDSAVAEATARGALVVVAAGNEGLGMCDYPGFSPFALCVGATDAADHVAAFSNRGVRVDVMAPGVAVWSTVFRPSSPTNHSSYGAGSGTSYSTPLVSGIAALLVEMGATNIEAKRIIECTADDRGDAGYDGTFGWGRVNAARAVTTYAMPVWARPLGCA